MHQCPRQGEPVRKAATGSPFPTPSRLIPNVAAMPVLGGFPMRGVLNEPINHFKADLLGIRNAARQRCRFIEFSVNEKLDLGRLTGFGVDLNDDSNSAKSGRPVAGFGLLPHSLHFSVLSPVLPVPEERH